MNAPVDMLATAIAALQPELDRSIPVNQRMRSFWSMAKTARSYAAADVVENTFMDLARESGLLRDCGSHGDQDARHVLKWAMRGMNPFGAGPLK